MDTPRFMFLLVEDQCISTLFVHLYPNLLYYITHLRSPQSIHQISSILDLIVIHTPPSSFKHHRSPSPYSNLNYTYCSNIIMTYFWPLHTILSHSTKYVQTNQTCQNDVTLIYFLSFII